jgi:hypothetical protein
MSFKKIFNHCKIAAPFPNFALALMTYNFAAITLRVRVECTVRVIVAFFAIKYMIKASKS